jgi:two-component system response regulator VicR
MAQILVVDDDHPLQQFLIDVLEDAGHQVRVVPHGAAAMQVLAIEPADLIITDIMMPHLDGIGVCAQVQADPALAHIPIILISAGQVRPPRDRCHYAAFLEKPFVLTTLLDTVDAVLPERS